MKKIKLMVMWEINIKDEPVLSLWALDPNKVPCYNIATVWGKSKLGCIFKLIKDLYYQNRLDYLLKIRKVRSKGLKAEEKAILRSYNYATGNPFE